MTLNRVKRLRFLKCLSDLSKLIDLAYKTIDSDRNKMGRPQAFKNLVVKSLKESSGGEYQSFDLSKSGLKLKLRVDRLGRIKGFVQLNEDLTTDYSSQMILNNFMFSSTLMDDAVEYDFW